MNVRDTRYTVHFFFAAALMVCAYIVLYRVMGQGLLSHSDYDSYTRQAQMWWQGRADLPENVTWLELARFGGKYYVSFPPFPSVIQFLLFPIFGLQTPDNLINTLFGLGAFVLVYRFMMIRGSGGPASAVTALLLTLGSNLFYLSLTGWVWFSAQTQSFFFSALAIYLIHSRRKAAWYFSFLALGIAFACRPFQILYVPLLLYMLHQNHGGGEVSIRTFVRYARYVLPLAAVGLLVAAYNHARFGSILEFGHNYLPEFAHEPQFSLDYVPGNFLEILKLPGTDKEYFWPVFNGTLFFLVNPAFVLLGARLTQGRVDTKRLLYLMCLLVHLVLTLSHKTMGGWQFGARYLVDMLPFALFFFADGREIAPPWTRLAIVLAALGIGVNIWGAVWFYTAFS